MPFIEFESEQRHIIQSKENFACSEWFSSFVIYLTANIEFDTFKHSVSKIFIRESIGNSIYHFISTRSIIVNQLFAGNQLLW